MIERSELILELNWTITNKKWKLYWKCFAKMRFCVNSSELKMDVKFVRTMWSHLTSQWLQPLPTRRGSSSWVNSTKQLSLGPVVQDRAHSHSVWKMVNPSSSLQPDQLLSSLSIITINLILLIKLDGVEQPDRLLIQLCLACPKMKAELCFNYVICSSWRHEIKLFQPIHLNWDMRLHYRLKQINSYIA